MAGSYLTYFLVLFSSFMYPDLCKFVKNEKFNPIQCQPGPKVVMTFYKDRAISKMSAQNLSHLSNLESVPLCKGVS